MSATKREACGNFLEVVQTDLTWLEISSWEFLQRV